MKTVTVFNVSINYLQNQLITRSVPDGLWNRVSRDKDAWLDQISSRCFQPSTLPLDTKLSKLMKDLPVIKTNKTEIDFSILMTHEIEIDIITSASTKHKTVINFTVLVSTKQSLATCFYQPNIKYWLTSWYKYQLNTKH